MSWKDNRRRKRTWYRHYRKICDELIELINASMASGGAKPVAAEAVIKMFFDLYESRRLHRRKRVANSAFESLMLAAADSGLTSVSFTPEISVTKRPPSIGEFGATSRTGTAPPELANTPSVYVGPEVYAGTLRVTGDGDKVTVTIKKEIPF